MLRTFILLVAMLSAVPPWAADDDGSGLHRADWMRETTKGLSTDLIAANDARLRLVLLFEQRGCIYCAKMHAEVFSRDDVAKYVRENFYVIQIDARGSEMLTDFDGDVLSEKAATRKWGLVFTPSLLFLPETVPAGSNAAEAAVVAIPGALDARTTLDLFKWVKEKRYLSDEEAYFPRYGAK